MNRLKLALALLTALVLGACGGGGGGGGGGSASLIGRVLSITTGGPTNPPSSIQGVSGSPSTSSDPSDGSFTLAPVSGGTTQVKVIPNHPDNWPVFTYNFPGAQGNTVIGDLWVGPDVVTLHGRVLSSVNGQPIANATISFGGQNGVTNASGVFNLAGVAYSEDTQTAFWGIVGTARANGFFKTDFNAAPHLANAGVVDVGDVLLTPSNDPNPPGPPYNITGRVLPIGGSSGCIVTLKQGPTELRKYNVGADGKYFFWIVPGNYTVSFQRLAQTAPDQPVNLTQPNETVTVPDVTLN